MMYVVHPHHMLRPSTHPCILCSPFDHHGTSGYQACMALRLTCCAQAITFMMIQLSNLSPTLVAAWPTWSHHSPQTPTTARRAPPQPAERPHRPQSPTTARRAPPCMRHDCWGCPAPPLHP